MAKWTGQHHGAVMKKVMPVFSFLWLIACAGVPASEGENESLNFELGLGWKICTTQRGMGAESWSTSIEETTSINWRELFTYHNFGLVRMDKAVAALKPAMESTDCNLKEATATHVECKHPRKMTGYNGDAVTA
jgi:hypothetical protein